MAPRWAAAAALLHAAAAAPYVPKGPRFSFDTMPVFFHSSNASGPINEEAIRLMARFPMVVRALVHIPRATPAPAVSRERACRAQTVEKFQGPCGNSVSASPACDQEAQIIEPLRAVKAIDPNISTVFYYNSVLDFPQYKLHARMLADPSLMLRDKDGNIVRMSAPTQVPGHTTDVFDFSNPRARALFIEECVNATRSGFVDGCFAVRTSGLPRPSPQPNPLTGCGPRSGPRGGRHAHRQRRRHRPLQRRQLPLQAQPHRRQVKGLCCWPRDCAHRPAESPR